MIPKTGYLNMVQFEVISSQTGNRVHSWSGTILEILFRQCYTCLNYIYLPWISANLSLNCRHSLWFSRLIRRQIFLSMVYWIFFSFLFLWGVVLILFVSGLLTQTDVTRDTNADHYYMNPWASDVFIGYFKWIPSQSAKNISNSSEHLSSQSLTILFFYT